MHSNFSSNDIFVSMLTFKKIIRMIFVNITDLDPNTYLQSIFLMLIFNFISYKLSRIIVSRRISICHIRFVCFETMFYFLKFIPFHDNQVISLSSLNFLRFKEMRTLITFILYIALMYAENMLRIYITFYNKTKRIQSNLY